MIFKRIQSLFKMDQENKETLEEQNEQTEAQNEQTQEIEELKLQLKEKEDAFLRLYAEFDNFRKRNAKERIELMKMAGKDVIIDFLSILDDINRAKATIETSENIEGVKEGVDLIIDKLWKVLSAKGLEEMDVIGDPFDSEIHEAITEVPAPSEEQIGKIIDQVERGYKLNDKIIRFPKVVVGK